MAEPWTQEQLEIERRREARRAENMELVKLARQVFVVAWFCGMSAYAGYQMGHSKGFIAGYDMARDRFQGGSDG